MQSPRPYGRCRILMWLSATWRMALLPTRAARSHGHRRTEPRRYCVENVPVTVRALCHLYFMKSFPQILHPFAHPRDPVFLALLQPQNDLTSSGSLTDAFFLQAKYALASLYSLVTRYPPDLSYLTTLHAIFLKVRLYLVSVITVSRTAS